MKFTKCIVVVLMIIAVVCSNCNKLVDVGSPTTSLTSENIYTNDASAASVLTGIYTSLSKTSLLWAETLNSISLVAGLGADELTLFGAAANANTKLVQYYQNRLVAGPSTVSEATMWKSLYANLYIVNLAIERLTASTSLTPAVKQQLTGEAKFLRALFYFYLVNLYGDVPLTTVSNYQKNAVLSRTAKSVVYQQIINDLKDAEELLAENYVGADAKSLSTERVRPNKWAAAALLARVYLYTGDWANAASKATALINNKATYDTVSLGDVFVKNSKESIWQLQPVNIGWNTEDARAFILPASGPTSNSSVSGYPVYISNQLLNAFEPADKRKTNWMNSVVVNGTTYYYPYKYKSAVINTPLTEYGTVLRLSEQYLIRAEARAQQDDISGATADLLVVRTRAGLGNTTANDKAGLLVAILKERQVELFTEWAHRWLDLKRTNNIDAVMTVVAPLKGTTWNADLQWYPIPLYDITQNPALGQNNGY